MVEWAADLITYVGKLSNIRGWGFWGQLNEESVVFVLKMAARELNNHDTVLFEEWALLVRGRRGGGVRGDGISPV